MAQVEIDGRPGRTRSLSDAIDATRAALARDQREDGHWCYELEADCTIPSEYILMMHFMDEVDGALQAKLARYVRRNQMEQGGWPLYYGGEVDISCTVKAYYALKLAGDAPSAAHMQRAKAAIKAAGGVPAVNVFTRIALATFGQVPWRAVPFIPVEIMLLPKWSPFHINKVSYWSRTVMVPLLILVSLRARAKNPTGRGIEELFDGTPEDESYSFNASSKVGQLYLLGDRIGRCFEFLMPRPIRRVAIARAQAWFVERLNCEDGLGAIFPAMVNACQALRVLDYAEDHPLRSTALVALQKLVIETDDEAYCQPCVSPVWDTGIACHALLEAGEDADIGQIGRGLEWLEALQVTAGGDWQVQRPDATPGGWAFQYRNDHYPDLDDTALVAWAMHRHDHERFAASIALAADWTRELQSANGGFASFDADNTHYHLNEIPFADHKSLLDPPTADVSARAATIFGCAGRPQDAESHAQVLDYLEREQEKDGPWFGRWGTNYVYGTWSVLVALEQTGIPHDAPMVRRAVVWLKNAQRADGGWGEPNCSYQHDTPLGVSPPNDSQGSTSFQTAWGLLGLMAAGEADSDAVQKGIAYLLETQRDDGGWSEPWFTAPGFPRVFYLKYHGYSVYFPLWALARYRNLARSRVADVSL